MKRLLSLATLYPNAHQPRFGTFVARGLEALAMHTDWQVTVINPIGVPRIAFGRYRALAAAAVDATENGVAVHRPRFSLIPMLGGPLNPKLVARAVLPLARRLHAEQPFDLIDAQFFYPDGPAAMRVARELGLPYAVKARGADISHWGRRSSSLRQMREAAADAARLLAVSQSLADDMAAIGLPRDKISVHYTGLDRDLFHPLDRLECRWHVAQQFDIDLPIGAPLLATVGAFIPRKGQAIVLDALAGLPAAHLLLVGNGPDEARLRAQVDRLGLSHRVHFLGSLDHTLLPVVLSAADAMVLPSASEGLANAWVEALACGCPLVITAAGGALELVSDKSAGLVVARNPAAVCAGIRAVLADPPEREAVASGADRFSWQSHAEALDAIYSPIVGR